jgi:predicted Fe-S protein YdhL (DUF1289 family)
MQPNDMEHPDWDALSSDERQQLLEDCRAKDDLERAAAAIGRGVDPMELDQRLAVLERVHTIGERVARAADDLAQAFALRLEGFPTDRDESVCLAAYGEQVREFDSAVSQALAFAHPS